MKTGLIITVGTRDIQIDREVILNNEAHDVYQQLYYDNRILLARNGGEFLLKNYNRYRSHLQMPIVKPCLDYCLRGNSKINHIILITTDQPESVGQKFYQMDTTYFGDLLVKLISDIYPKDKFPDVRKKTVGDTVNYLDSMMLFWQKELHRKPYNLLKECDKVYLCNQGGMDTINTSLLLQCLSIYRQKTEVLQVDERTGLCTPLEFTRMYLEENEKLKMNELLDNYQYAAIKKLNVNKNAKALAAYAESRLIFDFEAAINALNQLDINYRELKVELQIKTREIPKSEKSLLQELCLNAWVKFSQEAYVDFLLRFFRILEELAKTKAMHHLSMKFSNRRWKKDIEEALRKTENAALRTHLHNKNIEGSKLEYTKPTTATFMAIVEHYDPEKYRILRQFLGLSSLRNNSIGAHSFDPVSKVSIVQELNKNNLSPEDVFEFLEKETGFNRGELNLLNEHIKST